MWWYVAVFVVALVISYASRPKPTSQSPAGLEDVTAPTAEDGIEIPVLFGTKIIKGANVVWYGNFKTKAIKTGSSK